MIEQKRIKFHIERQRKLRANRVNWDSLWQDLSDYFCPGRINAIRRESDGSRRSQNIYDNTGADAVQNVEMTTNNLVSHINCGRLWKDRL